MEARSAGSPSCKPPRSGKPGPLAALRFALANAGPLIAGARSCPLLGIVFCALLSAPCSGSFTICPLVGPALAGIGLFLPLAAGLAMTPVSGRHRVAGWPLFQAATAGGAEDALDALSRVFGYLNQRLGSYAALVCAGLAGRNGGTGSRRLADIRCDPLDALEPEPDRALGFDRAFLQLGQPAASSTSRRARRTPSGWAWCVCSLTAGSSVFSGLSPPIFYLWLRLDVDGSPWSEIDKPVSVSPEDRL